MKRIIALVLSLVMALSLCTPAWGATNVSDLAGLKTAVGEINVTQTIEINEEVSLTNLTITTSAVDAFKVVAGGTLTLGEGVIITSDVGAVFYANGGNIVINGAEVTADSGNYALAYLDNGGSITVNSGLLSHNGNDAHAIELAATGCTATVTGGEVYSDEGTAIGITSTTGGTVIINGGTVSTGATATFAAVYGYSGTITVSGDATITSANDTPALLASSNSCDPAEVNVSGGNIKSVGVKNDADADDVSITGGTFASDVSAYIDSAKDVAMQDGKFVVVDTNDVIAKIGDVKYASLASAVAAAQTGDTITLLKKVTIDSDVAIENVAITTDVVDALTVTGNGTLTLGENVTITSTKGAILYANGGTINIDGAEITATNPQYAPAAVDSNGMINVKSGKISSTGNAVVTIDVMNGGGEINVSGGEVYSGNSTAIITSGTDGKGSINISGGTVSTGATATYAAVTAYSGSIKVTDGAITSANNTPALLASSNNCTPATVSITGGNIKSVGVENDADAEDVSITGGTFTAAPDKEYIEEGYEFKNGQVSAVVPTYTVTFDSDGGDTVAAQTVTEGEKATKPADPNKEGFTFSGWYTDAACTNAYDFNEPVNANITLYAKWTENDNAGDGDGDGDNGNTGTTTPVYPPFYGWGGIVEDEPEVKSPETFDAGVALYVGMSVVAAVGTVTLSKKRED